MAKVAVVFPAYNEERRVAEAVEGALAVGVGRVVCVNDCSSDGTGPIIDRLSADSRVRALHHTVNQGKQAAVKHGLEAALRHGTSSVFAVLDADMQNDPALLPGLAHHVGHYDVVIGYRLRSQMPLPNRFSNAMANVPYRILAAIRIRDVQSGYRLYSRQAAQYLAGHLAERGRYTLEHTSMLLLGKLALERGRDVSIVEVEIPCSYEGAVSRISLVDNLQLIWAFIYHASALARLQSRVGY